jgi:ribonuclease HI
LGFVLDFECRCSDLYFLFFRRPIMSDTGVLTIHTDGAARGNPGPAAFAFIIERAGAPPVEEKGTLGPATNNVAEYTALIRALERARELGGRRLHVHSDSELMVKQLRGEYQVKNEDLRGLWEKAQDLADHFEKVDYRHVRREQNRRADRLCNEALDGAGSRPPPGGTGSKKPAGSRVSPERQETVREEALACLRAAAAEWSRGNAGVPSPELVWDQLWSILEEAGVVRTGSKS